MAPPKKPILAFLLDVDTPWPTSRVDAMSTEPQRGEPRPGFNIARFRSQLATNHLAGMFRTPDDLASQVAAAVAAQGLNQFMVDRVLGQTSVDAGKMGGFGEGTALEDSTIRSIKSMVAGAGSIRAIVVDLGDGDRWWSTPVVSSLQPPLRSNKRQAAGVQGRERPLLRDGQARRCS
jgi:hypothetical protein